MSLLSCTMDTTAPILEFDGGGDADNSFHFTDMKQKELVLDVSVKPKRSIEDELRAKYQQEREAAENQLRQQATLFANLVQNHTIDIEEIQEKIDKLIGPKTSKTPVSVLYEYTQTTHARIEFVEIGSPVGPSHKPRFTMCAVVDGVPYDRVRAGTKKQAKNGAAFMAWTSLLQSEISMLETYLAESQQPHHGVATLAHIQYLKLVLENPFAFTGRRVLAAFIMKTHPQDVGTVVSLATGNRCIASVHLQVDGKPVNDSHAEVIARRGLLRFLYKQLKYSSTEPNSIFVLQEDGKYKLRPHVTFDLYISQAPCGDAAVFTRADPTTERLPIFDSKHEGLLRNKLEDGEGTPPSECCPKQTLVSLQFGTRLKTMSCSDKICKWNVVGLQGALLSQLIEPVYLNSLVIGDVYSYGHISRAVYYRLSMSVAPPTLALPRPFCAILPDIDHGKVEGLPKETEKTLPTSVNWTLGDSHTEILEGNTGLVASTETDAYPRICKLALYENFKDAMMTLKGSSDLCERTYYDAKQAAVDYQQAKHVLFDTFSRYNLGCWVHKPQEIDYFTLE